MFGHGITYSGHASVCAAAQANLDILEREGLVERVRRLESALHQTVRALAGHELVAEVRSGEIGLLAGVQLHDMATAEAVADVCIENGLLMRAIGDATLQISPPFVIEEDDLALLGEVLRAALDGESGRLSGVSIDAAGSGGERDGY